MRRAVSLLFAPLLLSPSLGADRAAAVELLVADESLLLAVDPETGERSVVSGARPRRFVDVFARSDGTIFVLDEAREAVLAVDPQGDEPTVVSGPRVGAGPPLLPEFAPPILIGLSIPLAVAADSAGLLFVATIGDRFEIDETNGDRVETAAPAAFDLALDDQDRLLALSAQELRRRSLVTGDEEVLSDATNDGQPLIAARAVVVDASGRIFVADGDVLEVDPETGDRTLVSGELRGTGPPFVRPVGLASPGDGVLYVLDAGDLGTPGWLVAVDPDTGDREAAFETIDVSSAVSLSGSPGTLWLATPIDVIAIDVVTELTESRVPELDVRGAGPAFSTLRGVTVDESGAIAVATDGTNRFCETSLSLSCEGFHPIGVYAVARSSGDRELRSGELSGTEIVGEGVNLRGRVQFFGADPASGDWILALTGIHKIGPPGLPVPQVQGVRVSRESNERSILWLTFSARSVLDDVAVAVDTEQQLWRLDDKTDALEKSALDALAFESVDGIGPAFAEPRSLVVGEDRLFATDAQEAWILGVDPSSGDREVVSGPLVGEEGPLFVDPRGLAFGDGMLFVVDRERGAVLAVDPATGNRTVISDAETGSGPLLERPSHVAYVPEPTALLLQLSALTTLVLVAIVTEKRGAFLP